MPVYNQNPTVKNRPVARKDSQGNIIPTSFSDLTIRNDYAAGSVIVYHGEAKPGASEDDPVWKIYKNTYDISNHLLTTTWPEDAHSHANSDYQFSWTGRAGYTFS
jgi:hypothetical protein